MKFKTDIFASREIWLNVVLSKVNIRRPFSSNISVITIYIKDTIRYIVQNTM